MIKSIFLSIALLVSGIISAQTFKTAVEYNDYIVNLQNEIGTEILKFNERIALDDATAASMNALLDEIVLNTQKVIAKIEKMKDFEGNIALRDNAIALFKFYLSIFSNEYRELIPLYFSDLNDSSVTEKMQVLLDNITQKEAIYDANFQTAQQEFAAAHNIELIENELQDEINGEE